MDASLKTNFQRANAANKVAAVMRGIKRAFLRLDERFQ